MSIAGGVHRALERGQATGCSVIQIFVKNQRQWSAPALTGEEIARWNAARRATAIAPVFAHASYLINLATPAPVGWRRAVAAFHDELERAEALGLSFVVIHPGSHRGAGREAGLRRVVEALDELTSRTRGYRVGIALENSVGAGDTIGGTFDDLRRLIEGARAPERVGVCLDTCHLFAAGYDLRDRQGYARTIQECSDRIGTRTVWAFHLNDSRAAFHSRLDRHEHIGRGQIGRAAFRWLLTDWRWRRTPMVLETPKAPDPEADIRNLRVLRSLAAGARSVASA
jgi:deoxyribonuclease-4